jgi:predicted transport protein
MLFSIKNKNLSKIKLEKFNLEKDIQEIIEKNLHTVFNLDLISSEFTIDNFRLDTVAYDPETCSFVIIEYKNNKNLSVIDQGFSYLSLMLNHKSDFILSYHDKNPSENLEDFKKKLDWSQSRVIFISPQFNNYQKQSIEFENLPIELWEIKKYENIIDLKEIKTRSRKVSFNKLNLVNKNKKYNKVNKQIKTYNEDYHLKNASKKTKELYFLIKEQIELNYQNIDVEYKKHYVAFKFNNTNVIDLCLQKSKIKCWINLKKGELKDKFGKVRDIKDIGVWGNGDYEFHLKEEEDLVYLMDYFKQSYNNKSA